MNFRSSAYDQISFILLTRRLSAVFEVRECMVSNNGDRLKTEWTAVIIITVLLLWSSFRVYF